MKPEDEIAELKRRVERLEGWSIPRLFWTVVAMLVATILGLHVLQFIQNWF